MNDPSYVLSLISIVVSGAVAVLVGYLNFSGKKEEGRSSMLLASDEIADGAIKILEVTKNQWDADRKRLSDLEIILEVERSKTIKLNQEIARIKIDLKSIEKLNERVADLEGQLKQSVETAGILYWQLRDAKIQPLRKPPDIINNVTKEK